MHAGVGADRREVIDLDVPTERRAGPEDRLAADVAVVGDVHVRHEEIAIADRRAAAATGGASMNRHELAKDVAPADVERGRLALVLQVLRRQADRGKGIELRAVADRRMAIDHGRRADAAVSPEHDVGTNHRVRPDDGAAADLCVRVRRAPSGRCSARRRTPRARDPPRPPGDRRPWPTPRRERVRRAAGRATPRAGDGRRARPACETSRCPRREATPARRQSEASPPESSTRSSAPPGISGAPGKCP